VIAYVDSSVFLRFVLEQPDRLTELDGYDRLITSVLAEVECLRAVENLRLTRSMADDEYLARRRGVYDKLRRAERVFITPEILARAAGPLPGSLRTLDAIHLATGLEWRGHREPSPSFATHDARLAGVAAAFGFDVIGA
jgi:predicted nucleic acid-binding protein